MKECKGIRDEITVPQHKRTQSAWYDPDDFHEKSEAIQEMLDLLYSPEGHEACEGSCDKEGQGCFAISLKISCLDGEADLSVATCTMFKKSQEAYVYEAKKKSKLRVETKCECKSKNPD
jgi:hypothetical protein